MDALLYIGIAALVIILLLFLTSLLCFYLVFYIKDRKPLSRGEYDLPPGEIYEPYYQQMKEWTDDIRERKHECVEIKSFDGLTLRGSYYEYSPDTPVELLFNGYRGNAERDLSGGVERCFSLGRSVILINQRASGNSDGNIVSFGVNESRDCLAWIDFATNKFGPDRKLIIGGISMGAATVMLAAGEGLPENVVCVMADCGYTSAKAIISKILKGMHLPVFFFYPLIRFGGMIFGGFDISKASPIEAVKKSKTPIVFIHGDTDDYVPYDMCPQLYEACGTSKKLVTIKGAGHGLAFPVDKQKYLTALYEFQKECNF